MGVIVTCKNGEDPFKHEGARVVTKDLPLKVHANFFYNTQGQLTQQSEVGLLKVQTHPSWLVVLVT